MHPAQTKLWGRGGPDHRASRGMASSSAGCRAWPRTSSASSTRPWRRRTSTCSSSAARPPARAAPLFLSEMLRQRCRTVASGAEIWPDVDQSWSTLCQQSGARTSHMSRAGTPSRRSAACAAAISASGAEWLTQSWLLLWPLMGKLVRSPVSSRRWTSSTSPSESRRPRKGGRLHP